MNLNQDDSAKNIVFLGSNSCKIKVFITSVKEMLNLTNYGHIAKSKIKFELGHKFLAQIMERSYDAIIFISKHFYLKETGVKSLTNIIKIMIMLVKKRIYWLNKFQKN